MKQIGYKKTVLFIICVLWLLQTAGLVFFQLGTSYRTFAMVSQKHYSYEFVREQDSWYKFIRFCQGILPSDGAYLFAGDWDRGHKLRYYLYPRTYVDGRGLDGDRAILQRIREKQVTHIILDDRAVLDASKFLSNPRLFRRIEYNSEWTVLAVDQDALEAVP